MEVDGCKKQKKILGDNTQTEKEICNKLRSLLSGTKTEKDAMMERAVLKAYKQLTKDENGFVTKKEKARAGNKLKKNLPPSCFPPKKRAKLGKRSS